MDTPWIVHEAFRIMFPPKEGAWSFQGWVESSRKNAHDAEVDLEPARPSVPARVGGRVAATEEGCRSGNGAADERASVSDEVLDGFVRDAHVGAEFPDSEDLVVGLVQRGLDFMDQGAAVTFAFSGDALDVFRVDADARDSGLHGRKVLTGKGNLFSRNGVLRHGVPPVRSPSTRDRNMDMFFIGSVFFLGPQAGVQLPDFPS